MRRAFTLIELLVVITILLALALFVVAVFRGDGSEKIRSAGRTGQSAILGARDRALHAKAKRGFRLIRDPSDSTLCTGFAYLQPIDNLKYDLNSIQLERPDYNADGTLDSTNVLIVNGSADNPLTSGPDPVADWAQVKDFFSNPPRIRIPAGTGQWYPFFWHTSGPYQLTATQPYLELTRGFVQPGTPGKVAFARTDATYSSCEIEMAPELLPQHQPIALPSGIVIDLDYSSPNVNANWPGATNIDIMYSPRGMVYGPLAALGPIHFALRDIRDASEGNNPGWVGADVAGTPAQTSGKFETLILTIFPQTGHVATYPVDLTDSDGDGNADNLFHFAQVGSAAGN